MKFLDSLLQLVYPSICVGCDDYISHQEHHLCDFCIHQLPRFQQIDWPDNDVFKSFWGRVNIQFATSFLRFETKTIAQRVLHEFKYKKNIDLGVFMGELMAKEFVKRNVFKHIDVIIPVPLHPNKQYLRGFNQSGVLAKGIATQYPVPVLYHVLRKHRMNTTQTKKKRYSRFINTESVFSVKHPELLENKHVLLVDDVITTGATLEACVKQLMLANSSVKISVCSLAYTI